MAYIRAAIVTIFLLACILIGYMVFTFNSQHELNVALESFQKGDIAESERVLKKLEKDLPPAKYHLYHAYISRDNNLLDQSNEHLNQAIQANDSSKDSNLLLEIYLNQAFNAYLMRQSQGMAEAIGRAKQIAGDNNEWVLFFTGIRDYDYPRYSYILKDWLKISQEKPLSPWMKKAFDQAFTPFWYITRLARSEIEEGQHLKVRQSLEQQPFLLSSDQQNDVNFLTGLTYIKEAQEKPLEAAMPYYKLAFSYFKLVPMQSEDFVEDQTKIAQRLQRDLLTLLDHRSFQDLSFYVSALENWEASAELDPLSKRLVALLEEEMTANNWKLVQELTVILNRVLKPSGMREALEKRFQGLVENSLETGDFSHIEPYWQAALLFSAHPDQLSEQIADLSKAKIIEMLPLDDASLNLTNSDFHFWQRIEPDTHARYSFANSLLLLADDMWNRHEEQKAIVLMKVALSMLSANDQPSFLTLIEDRIVNQYEMALQQDNITQLPYVLEAVQQLGLTGLNIQDKREIERQLEEAKIFFADKRYPETMMKAAWVLRVAPRNQMGMQLMGLTHYQEAEYAQALPYLQAIEIPGKEVREAHAVCEIMAGDAENGKKLLDETSCENPINRETYRHLGFQMLMQNDPKEGLGWLSKITPLDNETLAGISYAEHLLEHWDRAVGAFNQLKPPFNQLWGIQGVAVLAHTGLKKTGTAEEILTRLLASSQEPKIQYSLLFNLFKKQALDPLNRHYIAANFYKDIKKDHTKAIRHFAQIDNPNLKMLLATAETYLALNQKEQALDTFEKFLEKSREYPDTTSLEPPILPLIGSLYMTQTFYPEAVKVLNRYFSLEPKEMSHRALYGQALINIGRYDLALEQFKQLEKADKLTTDHMIDLVDCYIHTNQFDQANALAGTLLSYNPPLSIFDRLKIGHLMLISGNEALFEASSKNIPISSQLSEKNSLEVIRTQMALGEYDKAVKIVKEHKAELMKNAAGLMALAQLEIRQSHTKEALQYAHQAEQLFPNDTNIGDFISRYERNPEYFTQTLQNLRKKIDHYPQRVSWQIANARNLIDFAIENQREGMSSEGLQQALGILDRLSLYYQEIPEIFCLMGQAHFLLDHHQQASEAFKKALKLNQSYVDAYKFLALVLSHDPNQAIPFLRQALKFAPDDAEAWQEIALLYEVQGKDGESLNALTKAAKYRPNDPTTYIDLAQLQMRMNQTEEAKTALERALVLEPTNVQALKLLLTVLHDLVSLSENPSSSLTAKQQTVYKTLQSLSPQETEFNPLRQ